MNKLFTYTVKIPEIFSRKEYDFIFIGYESVGRLVKRKDIPYTSEPISDTFSEPISEIVFLGHIHGKWDRHRIELKAKDYLEPETPHVHEQTPERLSLQNNFYIYHIPHLFVVFLPLHFLYFFLLCCCIIRLDKPHYFHHFAR